MAKINYKQVKELHQWVKDNMRHSEDGTVYGCWHTHYQILLDGKRIGDVFQGSFKASEEERKNEHPADYWLAYKDGKIVSEPVKTRKKAVEALKKLAENEPAKGPLEAELEANRKAIQELHKEAGKDHSEVLMLAIENELERRYRRDRELMMGTIIEKSEKN